MNPVAGLKLLNTKPASDFLSRSTQVVLLVFLSRIENFHFPLIFVYPLKSKSGLGLGGSGLGGGATTFSFCLASCSMVLTKPGGKNGEYLMRSLAPWRGRDATGSEHTGARRARVRSFIIGKFNLFYFDTDAWLPRQSKKGWIGMLGRANGRFIKKNGRHGVAARPTGKILEFQRAFGGRRFV
jgi:hypothetical protein